ncbi:MAG: transcription antitermination factor NusB [Candidatus Aminicenantes bacterium RBG_16_63_14]|nr:MAG: transcription antitermination factor NusB [Candidatus Aminicenantes bacterium RBG_16_63_14]OGD25835.1 MAG: transcription antitermination factor NusB [Candidatus Aminicenantes bacterium RBG_19FT_COMBO_65_30]
MGQRRKARECALQILFQLEFNSADPKALVKVYWEHQKASRQVREYGTWIVEKILDHGEAIDRAIQSASKNWRLSRMAVVDRNILRIAVCELLYETTLVPAIVMDEAIEIAKRYSGEESAVFVNGVLDAVGRLLEGKADEPAGPGQKGEHEQKRRNDRA